jgi:diaminohydroxyphosphoribosylaminopyrimidine deaminase/5-amino-6-(5-phosphoribosylamino)uracil reductase
VVVGIGTALADDPALDVRLGTPQSREPLRVVVDSRARLPVSSRVIRGSEGRGNPGRAVVAVTDAADPERLAALEARGATVLRCKAHDGRVDISDLLARLGEQDAIGILVEGGGQLAGAFLEAGLVDRIVAFGAPVLLGGTTSPGALGGPGLSLPEGVRVSDIAIRSVGHDWVIQGDVRRGSER